MEIQYKYNVVPTLNTLTLPNSVHQNNAVATKTEWEMYDTVEELAKSRKPTIDVKKEVNSLRYKMKKQDKSLYLILADAYKLFSVINTSNEPLKNKYRKDIESLQGKLGQKKTSTLIHTAIVRLVFDASEMERQRVSTYAAVLKNAAEGKVLTEDFSNWLEKVGGIDKASRLGRKSDVEPIDIDSALADLEHFEEMTTLSVSGFGKLVKNNDFEFKLAFCKWDSATGQLSIYKLIENEEKVKAAFKPFAKEVSEAAIKKVAGQALLDKVTNKNSAIGTALGELS